MIIELPGNVGKVRAHGAQSLLLCVCGGGSGVVSSAIYVRSIYIDIYI